MELREWYMKAAKQFEWSKAELIAYISVNAHESVDLAMDENLYNMDIKNGSLVNHNVSTFCIFLRSKEVLKIAIR